MSTQIKQSWETAYEGPNDTVSIHRYSYLCHWLHILGLQAKEAMELRQPLGWAPITYAKNLNDLIFILFLMLGSFEDSPLPMCSL